MSEAVRIQESNLSATPVQDRSGGTDYEIVRYEPRLKDQILKLQRELWGPNDAENAAYFAWKYEHGPAAPNPLIYVAMQADEVAGMRGFWQTTWQPGASDRTITLIGAGDLVVAPKHRRKGLFRKIMRFAEADLVSMGYEFFINLSASPITYLSSVKQGWTSIGKFRTLRKETAASRLRTAVQKTMAKSPVLWRYADRQPSIGVSGVSRAFSRLDTCAANAGLAGEPSIRVEKKPRASDMARIVRQTGSRDRLTVRRDTDYFSWRYASPRHEYRFLFSNPDNPDGYMVLESPTRSNRRDINIVDWEATDRSIKKDLLNAAIRNTDAEKISIWSGTLGEIEKTLLFDARFREFDESRGIEGFNPSVLIKPISERNNDPKPILGGIDATDPANWDLRMSFSDNF